MLRRTTIKLIICLAALCMSSAPVMADLMNPNRPWGTSSSLSELQGAFDAIGSTIDAVDDQEAYAIFQSMGAGTSTAAYIATISWGWPDLEFGIYEYGNPDNKLELFSLSGTSVGDQVVIQFNEGLNTVRTVNLQTLAIVDQTTYFKEFGFYAITTTAITPGAPPDTAGPFYSEDSLNAGGYPRFLTYEGKGDMVEVNNMGMYNDAYHWYIATEAGTAAGTTWSEDFSDFLVQFESIEPVPAPTAILLGILGLSAVGIKLRKYA